MVNKYDAFVRFVFCSPYMKSDFFPSFVSIIQPVNNIRCFIAKLHSLEQQSLKYPIAIDSYCFISFHALINPLVDESCEAMSSLFSSSGKTFDASCFPNSTPH